MKKRLTTIIQELEEDQNESIYEKKTFDEALQICKDKFDASCFTGKGKNTWVSADCIESVKDALRIPEIAPSVFEGIVVRIAPNPSYVYCYINALQAVFPCVVPRRMQSSMLRKKIKVHRIKDETGETFRYEKPKIYSN